MARTVPAQPEAEAEPAEELVIRLPNTLTIRDVIALEHAVNASITEVVAWLEKHQACDLEQLLNLGWVELEALMETLRAAVRNASRVPPRTS